MGWKSGISLFGLTLAMGAGTLLAHTSSDQGPNLATDPAVLVRQLGDERFSVRERALKDVVKLGVRAIGALEEGVRSQDREISFRSARALIAVRARDFERRLQAFATGKDAQERYQLPSWSLFGKTVGNGPQARSLFVVMQRAESRLLAMVEQSPERASEALVTRIEELQQAAMLGRPSAPLSLGTVATVLFIVNNDRSPMPPMTMQYIATYLRHPSFSNAIQSGAYRGLLREMLGTWIANGEGWDAYQAIHMALQYDIPQGLVPAKKILAGDINEPNQPYFRCYALLAFAKFGDESHIPFIESFLDDTTPYGGTVKVDSKAKYRPQIRDVALATLVKLAKRDHEEFGFVRLSPNSIFVFNTTSVAFEDDTKRDKAIEKWRAFRTGGQQR